MATEVDAVLVVSFGGPEGPDDVLPFLDNVLRGRNVPESRKLEVAEHYYRFGGRSPIGTATLAMAEAIAAELKARGASLPVYVGNRNWHPMLADTMRTMAAHGVRRALALVTSAFGSYSSCRQYLEDIERARGEVGEAAPMVEKLGLFCDHPEFLAMWVDRVRAAGASERAPLLFTAHSIPVAMAETGPYREQLQEAAGRIAEALGRERFQLAYSSRSGPPQQPWLEPSVEAALDELAADGASEVVVVPLGFLSDHMEVVYDLDVEAREHAEKLGLGWTRVETVGSHPAFAAMVGGMVRARLASGGVGSTCAADCCTVPAGRRRANTPDRTLSRAR